MSLSRRSRRTIAATGAVAALIVAADVGAAAHAEHELSTRLEEMSNLPVEPYVGLGGMAYLSSLFTGQWSSVSVRARDLEVPGFGLVSVESGAVDVQIPPESVWTAQFHDSETKKFFVKLQLDGLSLGRQMGFDDLVIQNLEDISPKGGWETEAIFEATPEGWAEPARVSVKLRVLESNVHIIPIEVLRAPTGPDSEVVVPGDELDPGVRDDVLADFQLFMRGADLPLELPPTRIFVSGGTVFIEAEKVNARVSPGDLLPSAQDDPALGAK